MAVLSAIVLPRASRFLDAIKVRGAVTEIEALFSTARHIAIARAAQASLEIDPAAGIILVRVDTDTLVKHVLRESEGVTLRATRTAVTYSPTGVGYGAANLTLIVSRNLVRRHYLRLAPRPRAALGRRSCRRAGSFTGGLRAAEWTSLPNLGRMQVHRRPSVPPTRNRSREPRCAESAARSCARWCAPWQSRRAT